MLGFVSCKHKTTLLTGLLFYFSKNYFQHCGWFIDLNETKILVFFLPKKKKSLFLEMLILGYFVLFKDVSQGR